MKFHELAVGDKFKFNNVEYTKIPEVRISCCKVQHNCQAVASNDKTALKPLDEVEKIQG
jgi:hypothetical protein